MERQQETNRSINPKKAAAILAKNGVHLNEKKVEEILDVMYFLAKLIVNQNFKK
ncbi:hypothetical protein H8S90_24645 [Olivibacter sp. SDN3]|uniref:hypothetical protein n=1 Tax=Olivibacter sp. SDN3 TaxID=2764720 RepID=UPI001651193D|nr:hypothetical protein [Olivibacter sp. SDN3]QNL49850.1 hypothetical protein H8S90_24645 [Olivibacter sp. SDN3]